jgi:hypothetical protein
MGPGWRPQQLGGQSTRSHNKYVGFKAVEVDERLSLLSVKRLWAEARWVELEQGPLERQCRRMVK